MSRVHWVIPIHGPIIIPPWSDPISNLQPIKGAPIPSSGHLRAHLPEEIDTKRPVTIYWTPDLLRHFMTSFLIPLHARQDLPFGSLSIRLSGPKPDPFINLSPPIPLSIHQHLPPRPPEFGDDRITTRSEARPIRPETGDHIRVYCDAKHALALRTWFHGVSIDRSSIGEGEGVLRLFQRTRLVLVGPRGEALIVA